MSYTRYPESSNQLTFYYQKSNIFNLVHVRTMYRAKMMLNDQKESMVDDYGMSSDEDDAFKIFIEDAVNDVLQIVLKMTYGVSDALVLNDSVAISSTTSVSNCYGVKVADEESFNENNLFSVDDGIKKYIQYHILASWYALTGLTDEEAKWSFKKDLARQDLITNRLFQLRKRQLT